MTDKDFTEMAKKLMILLREEKMQDGPWAYPTYLQVGGEYTLSEHCEEDVQYLARVLQKLLKDVPR